MNPSMINDSNCNSSSTEDYWSCCGQQEEKVSIFLMWRAVFFKKLNLIMVTHAVPTAWVRYLLLQC